MPVVILLFPVHQDQVAEFLGDGVFLSGPKESNPRHEEDGSAEADVAVKGDRDLVGVYPSAPGHLKDVAPGNSDFANIVGNHQAIRIDGHLLETNVIPVDAPS